MNPTRAFGVLVAALLLCAWSDRADDAVMVEKVWIPDGWTEPEIEVQKQGPMTSYKPSVPSGFKERTLGATIGLESVTVHEAKVLSSPKTYVLDLGEGQLKKVQSGTTVRIGKNLVRVIGDKDGVLYLQNTKTKRLLRYVQKDR